MSEQAKPRMTRLQHGLLMQRFINLKLDVLNTALPQYVMSDKGDLIEVHYDSESERRLQEIDAMIERFACELDAVGIKRRL